MSRLPETGPSLRRYLTQQKRQANRAGDASPFSRSGSGVTAVDEVTYEGVLKILGQMVVDGTLTVNGLTTSADFDGDLAAGDAGTTGWAMNAARVAIGELILRPGSIGNEALAHPVIFDGTSDYANNFAVPTVFAQVVSATFTVPDGMTSMSFTAIGTMYVSNTSGALNLIAARPRRWTNGVLTNYGSEQRKDLDPGKYASVIVPYVYTDTVVAGDVIDFTLEVRAYDTALALNANFAAQIEVSITLTR